MKFVAGVFDGGPRGTASPPAMNSYQPDREAWGAIAFTASARTSPDAAINH